MSPRRHPPRRETTPPIDLDRVRHGVGGVHAAVDGDWAVRMIPGGSSPKAYRCPGCDQEIPPGTAHLVAWPADERGDLSDRRHWHTGCWRARDRRTPVVQRSRNAPRYG